MLHTKVRCDDNAVPRCGLISWLAWHVECGCLRHESCVEQIPLPYALRVTCERLPVDLWRPKLRRLLCPALVDTPATRLTREQALIAVAVLLQEGGSSQSPEAQGVLGKIMLWQHCTRMDNNIPYLVLSN